MGVPRETKRILPVSHLITPEMLALFQTLARSLLPFREIIEMVSGAQLQFNVSQSGVTVAMWCSGVELFNTKVDVQ